SPASTNEVVNRPWSSSTFSKGPSGEELRYTTYPSAKRDEEGSQARVALALSRPLHPALAVRAVGPCRTGGRRMEARAGGLPLRRKNAPPPAIAMTITATRAHIFVLFLVRAMV